MALNLNLLHERILEQRQRQRDPLKLGMIFVGAIAALLFVNYLWNGLQGTPDQAPVERRAI